VLDPRITYEGLKLDFANDPILLADLERSKDLLCGYYNDNYAVSPVPSVDISNARLNSSGTSDFMTRYASIIPDVVDELEEYFKTKRKDFKKCDPLRWWRSQREDWPNLYRLACDILCIPGL
jgi:hAT family C-terminal dimerisation region